MEPQTETTIIYDWPAEPELESPFCLARRKPEGEAADDPAAVVLAAVVPVLVELAYRNSEAVQHIGTLAAYLLGAYRWIGAAREAGTPDEDEGLMKLEVDVAWTVHRLGELAKSPWIVEWWEALER